MKNISHLELPEPVQICILYSATRIPLSTEAQTSTQPKA